MKSRKLAFLGLSVALALILSFVESQIPVFTVVPGMKLGLPNLVMVFLLYRIGWKETAAVSLVRVLLVSLLFGNAQSLVFSLAGAVLSLAGMALLKKSRLFSPVAVSVTGGVLHNIGQIIAACLWTGTAQIAYYLPVLLLSGIAAGILIGLLSGLLLKRLSSVSL
mgnify:FL=1